MREQFERINNPRSPSFAIATKLNLPTSYLLIHRTWLGGLGVLSQLECRGAVPRDHGAAPAGLRRLTSDRQVEVHHVQPDVPS